MIISFGNKITKDLFDGIPNKQIFRFPKELHKSALNKLTLMNGANALDDLRIPPGNRLEALKGDLKGFHSIRINNQWRIIFKWTAEGPTEVEIVDYH